MDNELYHHGVKGMKWGVRKDRRSSSSMKAKRSLKNANAQQNKINRTKYPTHKQLMKSTSAKQIYKNRNRLSDKELDNRINRMEKEQHLKDLSRKQESEGKKWVKKILVGAGTAIASQYAVTYGKKMAEYILKIKHDDSYSDELYHHGIKGMKWGVRQQRESLGSRYRKFVKKNVNKYYDKKESQLKERRRRFKNQISTGPLPKKYRKFLGEVKKQQYDEEAAKLKKDRTDALRRMDEPTKAEKARLKKQQDENIKAIKESASRFVKTHKKEIAIGAGIIATGLAVYGGYKLHTIRQSNKAAITKYIEDNPAFRVQKTSGLVNTTYSDGVREEMNIQTQSKLTNTFMGPRLDTSRTEELTRLRPSGKEYVPKMTSVRNDSRTIGSGGGVSPMTKKQRKEYADLYEVTTQNLTPKSKFKLKKRR